MIRTMRLRGIERRADEADETVRWLLAGDPSIRWQVLRDLIGAADSAVESERAMRPEFLKFWFPPRWHYDLLRGLDYFQSVAAPRDERLNEAIEVLREHRRGTDRWDLEGIYAGKTYFQMERVGSPSRWNTLRALRVLRWWESGGHE